MGLPHRLSCLFSSPALRCFQLGVLVALSLKGDSVEAQIKTHFGAGIEATRTGHFSRAVEEYKEVLRLDPTLAEAHVNLGLAYHSLGEYRLAVAEFAKALSEKPDIPGANLFLGIDYLKVGAAAKAIAPLTTVLQAQPSNQEARRALAACYVDQERYRLALEQFRILSSFESDKAEALFVVGRSYLELAKHLADRMSRRYQNTSWAYRLAGDLLSDSSRWSDAAFLYEEALKLDSNQPELHASLGNTYLQQEKLQAAEEAFQAALRLDPRDMPALLGMAELQLAAEHAEYALASLNKIWGMFPPFLAETANFPAVRLEPSSALRLATDVEAQPESGATHFLLSRLLKIGGQEPQASAQETAFERDLGAWKKQHQNGSEALSNTANGLTLARALFELANYVQAADVFAGILSQDADNLAARYWLARSYKRLADDSYTRLVEEFPDSGRAHQFRAESDQLREAYDSAVKEYQVAIRLLPEESELHEKLSQIYLEKKSFSEAEQELRKALELDPGRPRTLYLLGRSRFSQHHERDSIPYLQEALRRDPGLLEACAALGQAYMRLREPDHALPLLEKAAPIDFHGDLHYLLYVAYRDLRKKDLAQKALARSQQLRQNLAAKSQARIAGIIDDETQPLSPP